MDQGYLARDPAARVKLVGRQEGSKRKGLSNSQINALLRLAQFSRDPERNYAIIQLLLQTGIRFSECNVLTFGDITFGERSGTLIIRAGKGNKVRSVPLNASARDAGPRFGAEKFSIKVVATAWPKQKSPKLFEPVFLSQREKPSRPQLWDR